MARLVAAFGTSHSIMLTAELDDWIGGFAARDPQLPLYDRAGAPVSYADCVAAAPPEAAGLIAPAAITRRFQATQAAMARLEAAIADARLDALVIVGDDQYELFQDAHMPAVAIYYGPTIRNAAAPATPSRDWYQRAQHARLEPGGPVEHPVHAALAEHLIAGLVARDFDVSAVQAIAPELAEGHAYAFVHRRYLAGRALPVVPVFLNTYNPPNQPRPQRCVALGRALGALIAEAPADWRVGAIASGGLSHFRVEEDLDQAVIAALRANDLDTLGALDPRRLQAGSSEIRNWLVVAGAAAGLTLDWIEYVPGYRTPALTGTGLCFAAWRQP
jgi:3-O-methylgallate 3,4-dioxygenase